MRERGRKHRQCRIAQVDRAQFSRLGETRLHLRSVCQGQYGRSALLKSFARRRNGHVTLVPLEQPGAHFLLEGFDLSAQRWLCDVQPDCRSAEAELFGDSDEKLELA